MGVFLADFQAVQHLLRVMARVEGGMNKDMIHRLIYQMISLPLLNSTPSPSEETDMFNNNSALLCEGLFFMNFLDAVSEGDGERIIRQCKYLMLICKADGRHSTKFALESLYQLLFVHGLSEKEAEKVVGNRGVNNHGGPGRNIPHDLESRTQQQLHQTRD